MREEQLRESATQLVELEPHQASALRRLGVELASSTVWWGAARHSDGSDDRSVIRIEPESAGRYRVTILNMIGAIYLEGVHIRVLPKIPLSHFIHIAQGPLTEPRSGSAAQLQSESSLAELIARWFASEAEILLRRGLRMEYAERTEELNEVRGQLQLLETALMIQQGQPLAQCRFDELAADSPLNRLVKGAAREIARNSLFSEQVRHRARLIWRRMVDVGDETPSDQQLVVDRLSSGYAKVVPLAKMVLRGLGIGLKSGDTSGRTFLLRTPEIVESGIRHVISRALPGTEVAAGRLMIGTTGLSLNPDLVFDRGRSVGDVKYKIFSGTWNRADLYQSIAFATAYRTDSAVLIGFHQRQTPTPNQLKIGDVRCRVISWDANEDVSPLSAQQAFENALRSWHSEHVTPE